MHVRVVVVGFGEFLPAVLRLPWAPVDEDDVAPDDRASPRVAHVEPLDTVGGVETECGREIRTAVARGFPLAGVFHREIDQRRLPAHAGNGQIDADA